MIELSGNELRIVGPMLTDNARSLLAQAMQAMQPPSVTFDLSQVLEADSSALAVMLALTREAQSRGIALSFSGVPEGVMSLAKLYGVGDFLPLH